MAATDPGVAGKIKARRESRGWSIRKAAGLAGLAPSTWLRIESGELGTDNRFTLAKIAAGLQCTVADLTGQDGQGVPTTKGAARREGLVHEIAGALLQVDLVEEPWCDPPPLEALRREVDLLGVLHRKCDYLGSAQRLPTVLRQLHAAARGDGGNVALRMMAATTALAGGTARYLGRPGVMSLAADRGQQIARKLNHPVVIAKAEYEKAHAAAAMGTYSLGLRISRRAAADLERHLGEPEALPVAGMLALTRAFCATAADDRNEVAEQVAHATELAQRTGETNVMMFGPTNVGFWRVSMLADGGDPGQAVEIARTLNPARMLSESRQVAFYLDYGRALSRLGEDESATRMLLTAQKKAPDRVRSNAMARETVRSLSERARRNSLGEQLRYLRERVGVTD